MTVNYYILLFYLFILFDIAQLKTRNLYKIIESQNSWDACINIKSHERAINELTFWNKNLIKLNSKVFIQYQIPKLIVSSDASNTGVAAYFTENCKQNICYRNLSSEEIRNISTWRELTAVSFGRNALWQTDNYAASIIIKAGINKNHLQLLSENIFKIVSIIRSLNSNKAHGWDGISIRMIKICDETIALPLKIIFDTALKSGSYPNKWKRANVVPVHKKESKNILKNYRPISLLPVCGKIFEKCIYNSLYSYLESNDILSKSQSGFRKGDSCISQLLAITHKIYSNFDAYPSLETRGVFLDISKAFDRVWHEGLLYKLLIIWYKWSTLNLNKKFFDE